jgi:hypothetical protein
MTHRGERMQEIRSEQWMNVLEHRFDAVSRP